MNLRADIAALIKGDVTDDETTLTQYSRDTSIFERKPTVVVFPKDADDVAAVVKYIAQAKARPSTELGTGGENLSIAPRSAGTDMTGGPLTDSVALVFSKYMNKIGDIGADPDAAVGAGHIDVEPGAYYRDVEKETLGKREAIIPSYPASRELCAIGGMIANNSGGELTLRYGKTNRYVRTLDVVLSDGSRATLKPLSPPELEAKKIRQSLEGKIYREVDKLLREHEREIEAARPNVTKNSAGYALWDVRDKKTGTFDLTQLITGSQGTLAIVTSAQLGLVALPKHRAMLVIFLSHLEILPEVVRRVLAFKPESFESYDDQTFKLAVRFLPQVIRQFGLLGMIKLGFSFIPESWLVMTGGVPKLVLLAEFAEGSHEEALQKARDAKEQLADLPVQTKIAKSESAAAKYWIIRRESFSLLRKNLRGLHAAPFIDDIVVHPDDYPLFLPELEEILEQYDLIYTIAGHIGDADFHIIPLVNLSTPETHRAIRELEEKVYALVAKYHGSITGEHNDGIIRTPYLKIMYGENIIGLFERVKKIFDPLNILNPGKKVGGTLADIERSMIGSAH